MPVKDIGSIYPIHSVVPDGSGEFDFWRNERYVRYFSLCREGLSAIARQHKRNGIVLLPAYTCSTVIDAFTICGYKCRYYSVRQDLRINVESLIAEFERAVPDILVVHPYFGMDLTDEEMAVLRSLKRESVVFVEDLTQCIFSSVRDDVFDYYTGSLRKWFPIPDGGFVSSDRYELNWDDCPDAENSRYVDLELAAMYLRGQYYNCGDERIKQVSREVDKVAQDFAEHCVSGCRMSAYSLLTLTNTSVTDVATTRADNFRFLHQHLSSSKVSKMCEDLSRLTTAPLYFPVLVDDRAELNARFIADSIYAPVIWPVPTDDALVSQEVRDIYAHIMALPVDHRYGELDMVRMCDIINRL